MAMTIEELKQQREEAKLAALRWDEKVKYSRYGCISDQERSTELWRKYQSLTWQLAELERNKPTTGAHQ